MSGPRLLLVHLFLPETLEFHDWPEDYSLSHFRVPSQAHGDHTNVGPLTHGDAPSSPYLVSKDLEVDELSKRLSRASMDGVSTAPHSSSNDEATKADDDEDVMSDSEGPALASIDETASASAPLPTKRGNRSARGSFNEQTKKVSMTALMNEAASGGSLSQPDGTGAAAPLPLPRTQSGLQQPRSRRGSNSASANKPVVAPQSTNETSLPVAAASDHGRSASSTASATGKLSVSPGAAQPGSIPRSRRGSANERSPGIPGGLGSAGLTMSSTSNASREKNLDGAGTRTPGAQAGGRAGAMTPLSIIGDLAAKQSSVTPRQMPTPGDTDRHHPFGSGAVTPMRESGSVGTSGARTPGPRPAMGHFSRSSATGLSLSKLSEIERPERSKSPQGGAPAGSGSKTPSKTPNRPHRTSDASTSGTTSGPPGWSLTDHGRGADAMPPPQHKPSRPSLLSRAATSMQLPDNKRNLPAASPRRETPPQHKGESTLSQGPPTAPSFMFGRASSKSRAPPHRQNRRQSSYGGRGSNRVSMIESAADEGVFLNPDDMSPALPPFDFVPNTSANGGLNNAVKSLAKERLRGGLRYIGTPGLTNDGWAGKTEKDFISSRMKNERGMVPVWVEDDVFDSAYSLFCKQVLWPTFHYTLPTGKGHDMEHDSFEKYRQLNESFADAVVAEYREGDIIFINDYHLLLVPLLVRERLPHSKICFFLHIAWPSSEIFRCLSARTHILRGMLGADLVGFQTANFARHFRQTVSRILQLEATPKGIQVDGRGGFVTVGTFPIGIDVAQLNERRLEPDVGEWVSRLRERYEGKKIIVGRDKLDFIKGVRQKLLAFEVALDEHKELVGKIVLLQVALATTGENEEVAMATDVVARINNKYSTLTYQPVVFLHVQDITFCQYLALLTVADAFLATSLREGMNLTSHEFVVCQEHSHKPLILSEFTGTYSSLRACIGINPWNTKQVADAIYKAVTMGDDEARERWKDLHRQVKTQDAQHWIQSLLGRLERAHIDQQRRNNLFMPRLEIGQSEWRASKSRLLLLDLEETLVEEDPVVAYQRGFEPPEELIKVLQDLTADAKNRVYVLSGKGKPDLDKLLVHVPRLGGVAENGCAIKYAGSSPKPAEEGQEAPSKTWRSLVAGANMSWRASVKEILTYFTERTPGSWLEDRGASILWRFWSGSLDQQNLECQEFQWARRQAAEVQNLIYDSLGERYSLRIIPGQTSFLIMPKNTSRASAVQHIVSLSSVGTQTLSGGQDAAAQNKSLATGEMTDSKESLDEIALSKSEAGHSSVPLASSRLNQATSAVSHSIPPASGRDSGALFRQPSNAWMQLSSSEQYTTSSHQQRAQNNVHMLHPYGLGSFDLVLCIGQDDMLFAYINSLDLSFAPITSTSSDMDSSSRVRKGRGVMGGGVGVGSEANYYVNGPKDVMKSLHDILAFRGRDQRWGVPAMVDV